MCNEYSTCWYLTDWDDLPNDEEAPGTNQEPRHDYDGPNEAFSAIKDLTQLIQAYVCATSGREKSFYGEFCTHKLPLVGGTTNLWAAESQINSIAKVCTILHCSYEEQLDLAAYMLTYEVYEWWQITRPFLVAKGSITYERFSKSILQAIHPKVFQI